MYIRCVELRRTKECFRGKIYVKKSLSNISISMMTIKHQESLPSLSTQIPGSINFYHIECNKDQMSIQAYIKLVIQAIDLFILYVMLDDLIRKQILTQLCILSPKQKTFDLIFVRKIPVEIQSLSVRLHIISIYSTQYFARIRNK